jgi:hypothetical protein
MSAVWIPAVAVGGAGLYLTASALRDIARGRASLRWPSVRGDIRQLGAHVGGARHGDEAGVIVFGYTVDGRAYESNVHDLAGRAVGRGAGTVLAKYAVGDTVTVYFDPNAPSNAMLDPGAGAANYRMLGVGALMLGAAAVLAWVALTAPTA